MTKSEAHEIYKIIKIINEIGLIHILNSTMVSKKTRIRYDKIIGKKWNKFKIKSTR